MACEVSPVLKARSACIAPTERMVEDCPWLGVASATAHQVAAPPSRRMAINRFMDPSDLSTLEALSPYVADGVCFPSDRVGGRGVRPGGHHPVCVRLAS